jgi:hypothetical protein
MWRAASTLQNTNHPPRVSPTWQAIGAGGVLLIAQHFTVDVQVVVLAWEPSHKMPAGSSPDRPTRRHPDTQRCGREARLPVQSAPTHAAAAKQRRVIGLIPGNRRGRTAPPPRASTEQGASPHPLPHAESACSFVIPELAPTRPRHRVRHSCMRHSWSSPAPERCFCRPLRQRRRSPGGCDAPAARAAAACR